MNEHKLDRQFRLARVWSNGELRKFGSLFCGDVVNVSAGEDVDKEGNTYAAYFPHAKSYSITNFAPGAYRGYQGRENEYLLDLSKPLPDELVDRFDVVFNHTTLEHVFDCSLAFRNLCLMSRDLVIAVVPFAQVQHDTEGYLDYWRIGPSAIRQLVSNNGFKLIYEAANQDSNAGIYIFFVASRHPDRWLSRIPAYKQLCTVGSQLGSVQSLKAPPLRHRIRSALRYVVTGNNPLLNDPRVRVLFKNARD